MLVATLGEKIVNFSSVLGKAAVLIRNNSSSSKIKKFRFKIHSKLSVCLLCRETVIVFFRFHDSEGGSS